jgi:hypothetical protein
LLVSWNRSSSSIFDEQGAPVPWQYLNRLYAKLANSYEPRRLEGRGVLFVPISKHERYIDDSLGRKGLFAAGLEIIPVLGDHRSMIRENNQALAQKITEVLGRY